MEKLPTRRGRGAPKGNQNALKTGAHTRQLRSLRANVRLHIAQANALIALVHTTPGLTRVTVTRDDKR